MDEDGGKVEGRVRASLLPGGFKANDVTERQLCGYVYFLLYITVKLVRRGWACLVQYDSFLRKSSLPYFDLRMQCAVPFPTLLRV